MPSPEFDERRPIETLFRLCRRPRVILDIGAGEGFYAINFRVFFPGADIYCFEPIATNFEKLAHNAQALSVTPVPWALGELADDVVMYRTATTECSSVRQPLPPNGDGNDEHRRVVGRESAPCGRLDDWLADAGVDASAVDIVKLDTQGSELDILRGAPELLKHHPIVMIEETIPTYYEGQPTPEETAAFMAAAGYRLECDHPSDTMPDLWHDGIYVAA
ncbi:hypothetical protein LCGC14_0323500 [marine sediment metagenome]|uniref:Methyltransferase FkbM domain-containing protein n=1 Tax=marine sediment metagenome TaxID=412755 RepID=A0A0F9W619_9ZZZZ